MGSCSPTFCSPASPQRFFGTAGHSGMLEAGLGPQAGKHRAPCNQARLQCRAHFIWTAKPPRRPSLAPSLTPHSASRTAQLLKPVIPGNPPQCCPQAGVGERHLVIQWERKSPWSQGPACPTKKSVTEDNRALTTSELKGAPNCLTYALHSNKILSLKRREFDTCYMDVP